MKQAHLMGEINTIALATDGSSYSDGAVQEAIFLGQQCRAKLIVIHVISITADGDTATMAHATTSAARTKANDYVQDIVKMADDNEIECEVVFEESYQPEKAIVEIAKNKEADVLIMGRHGKKGLLQLMVGSMTSKVIGLGFPKVLVVPHATTGAADKVLLATDGSTFSLNAAEDVLSMAENCSTLKTVFVTSVATKEADLDKAKERAEEVCTMAKGKNLQAEFISIAKVGRPSDVIIETAKEKGVDMIVMGGHGKGLTKLLMGHVTEKVIGRTEGAVLVVEDIKK